MTKQSDPIEAVRAKFRPERIVTLFVGESAPNGGGFFYLGNTAMARNMDRAMGDAGLSGNGDFLERFKAYGWYLDDLVLAPVNDLAHRPGSNAGANPKRAWPTELRNIVPAQL